MYTATLVTMETLLMYMYSRCSCIVYTWHDLRAKKLDSDLWWQDEGSHQGFSAESTRPVDRHGRRHANYLKAL